MSKSLSALPLVSVVALLLAGCRASAGPVAPPPSFTAANVPAYMGGYRLPVEGAWRVHRTHYDMSNDQAFAVDLVLDADHPKRGGRNADYPSYGQRIVADGPGVIAIAVDGIPENEPNYANGYEAHGNFVVIDHRNREFSLFAHLIPGSLKVRPGQVVGMGQDLGLCGNSGHSTMAHLHWQVMDQPQAHLARARAIRLIPYEKNGAPSGARLERNDVVRTLP